MMEKFANDDRLE